MIERVEFVAGGISTGGSIASAKDPYGSGAERRRN